MTDGTVFHTNVAMDGSPFQEYNRTVNLATGIVRADVGKAVQLDTTGPNKFKLVADNGRVDGRLLTVESRVGTGQLIGTVALKFIDELPVVDAEVFAIGDTAIGAGSGQVKVRTAGAPAADTPDANVNQVVEVRTGYVVVMKI